MKIALIVYISFWMCLAPTSSASTRPFRLVNESGEDLLESIANDHKMDASPPGAPRFHTPKASASVQAPAFEANNSDPSPLQTLTNNGELSLETVISNAFDKIHSDWKTSSVQRKILPMLRRFEQPADTGLSKEEASLLEEAVRNAFDTIHQEKKTDKVTSSSKSPAQPIDSSTSTVDNLSKHEANCLEETLRDALDKIHKDRKNTIHSVIPSVVATSHQPRLRGNQKSPFIPIDVDVMKRYNERNGKAF